DGRAKRGPPTGQEPGANQRHGEKGADAQAEEQRGFRQARVVAHGESPRWPAFRGFAAERSNASNSSTVRCSSSSKRSTRSSADPPKKRVSKLCRAERWALARAMTGR